MSLKNDLYELYRRADSLEVFEKIREREAEEVAKERDALIIILDRLKEEGVYKPKDEWEFTSTCRICDATMPMKPWDKQYCSHCTRD